ncbi:MAG: Glycosyl transferase family 9 [uncultured bacterium]|nr:MAG: Glycosyl transferase family 9 [uncultured bacterium]
MIKQGLIAGIEFFNGILDDITLKTLNPALNNTTICLEDRTIGDSLLKLPYYAQIKDEDILILCGKNADLFQYFLPQIRSANIQIEKFFRSPKYRYKKLNEISPGKTIPKRLLVTIPYRPTRFMKLAKKFPAKEKLVYQGESILAKSIDYSFDKDFNIIPNPRFVTPGVFDVHFSRHIKTIFESAFNREFNITKDDYLNFYKNSIKRDVDIADYIVLMADSARYFRKYPDHNWQTILNNLPKDTKIIVLGTNEVGLDHPKLINLTNKTTMIEAIKLIQNAKLVIGNETGFTHLAYLSGIPTVCVLSGGHYERFLPWDDFNVECVYSSMDCFQCNWDCKYHDLKRKDDITPLCLDIAPEAVLERIELLNQKYNIFQPY